MKILVIGGDDKRIPKHLTHINKETAKPQWGSVSRVVFITSHISHTLFAKFKNLADKNKVLPGMIGLFSRSRVRRFWPEVL